MYEMVAQGSAPRSRCPRRRSRWKVDRRIPQGRSLTPKFCPLPVINPERRFRALYEVGSTWDSDEPDSAQIGEADLKRLPVRIETPKASLWFYGRQISDRLQFEVEYDTDLFARETMEFLLQRFRFLLTHVSDLMDALLATLSLQKDDPANGPMGSRIKLDL